MRKISTYELWIDFLPNAKYIPALKDQYYSVVKDHVQKITCQNILLNFSTKITALGIAILCVLENIHRDILLKNLFVIDQFTA